jgi:predicted transcriptional regulator
MKKGPLSNSDKDFILKNKNRTVKFLSKKLDRTESSIQTFLDSLNQDKQLEQPVVEEVKNKGNEMLQDSFARNKRAGAVVMTETASMISDALKRPKKPSKHIFIMNPDKT